ncbi:hypothetical protein EI171_21065 [Bradyrhizobium sp. LCT2]|uniref:hypothetical protein n=1 Tax=Bradyrhizobium sp. LCT2 TaxID=2493093 RepID=UPI0013739CD9|nr:hypothetical protein [Bradyrhizobium sp. LCT2]QHP69558.1 hypothetical protein EI171_21065 [Bradyrhizobium sp. LCT2]
MSKVVGDPFDPVEALFARQVALEAIVTQVLAALSLKIGPNLSAELVAEIRGDLHAEGADHGSYYALLVEEHVAKLADRIERAARRAAGQQPG